MTTACMIVIGHVDHGKTALVRALTGIETDTLDLEKQRGFSITLGFAHCALPSGTVDLIDAPGHEDFIRAMVAGATGAQAAMLVVSAVDGVAPQTVEHLRIAQVLGVQIRVVAVTKADLVAPAALPDRLDVIRAVLADLGVEGAPLIPCSVLGAPGVAGLIQTLGTVLPTLPTESTPTAAFLPIDRVFSVAGLGTVVTGTLLGDALSVDNPVVLHPRGRQATIRGLQSRGIARDRVTPGERTAVNLRGVTVEEVACGDVVCAIGPSIASECLDVHIALLADAPRALKHMQDVRVLFGTSHEVATLRLMGGGQIAPGASGFAQLRFRRPVMGFAGQPALLRSLSPALTFGGALIVDPQAPAAKSGDIKHLAVMQAALLQDVPRITAAVCDEGCGAGRVADIARLSRCTEDDFRADLPAGFALMGSNLICSLQAVAAAKQGILMRLQAFHAANPLKLGAPQAVLHDRSFNPEVLYHAQAALVASEVLRRQDDHVAIAAHDPWAHLSDVQNEGLTRIEDQFRQGGLTPPDLQTVCPTPVDVDLLDLLIAKGRILPLTNVALKQRVAFHAGALDQAAQDLQAAFPPPLSFTTGQARTALNTSRKFIVPLLEYFDTQGISARQDDRRQMALKAQ